MTTSAESEDRQRVGSRRRSVARLAAVQALYQLEANSEADPELFADIVCGATDDLERLDTEISAALTDDWPLSRLDSVLRAILRAGAYELIHRRDVPPRVSLSEYTAIAYAFFTGKEPGLANGVLNHLAHTLRDSDL